MFIVLSHNSSFLSSFVPQIIIVTSVIALTAFNTHNLFQLKQKFDQSWFIPKTTYLHNYLENHQLYYPDAGLEASIYMGRLNYTAELPKLCTVSELLKNQTELVYDVDAWIDPFQKFVEMYFEKGIFSPSLVFTSRHLPYLATISFVFQMFAVVR